MADIVQLPDRPGDLTELEVRRAEIRGKRKATQAEIAAIRRRLYEAEANDPDLDAAAEGLIAGEDEQASEADLDRLRTLEKRLEILRRADQLLTARIADLREKHNSETAAALRPSHRKAVRRIAHLLLDLERANVGEEQIRGRVPGVGLPAMDFPSLGHSDARGGPIRFWMEYARRHGYLDGTESEAVAAE